MTEAQSRNTQAPDAEPETRKSRHWWFWPLVIVLVLLLVPLLLVVAVLLALRSETGTAWVIEQVPGLRTEAASSRGGRNRSARMAEPPARVLKGLGRWYTTTYRDWGRRLPPNCNCRILAYASAR